MYEFDLQAIKNLHWEKTIEWHKTPYNVSQNGFLQLVEENHYCNFELWHEEDKARRDDKGYLFVYQAKRNIDVWNQKRNDSIEKIDLWLIERIPNISTKAPLHSETPGMIIDRLSILALKSFHMKNEAERETAHRDQRADCMNKLKVIQSQHSDLSEALSKLMTDIVNGKRRFRIYSQFKMYNDPMLNPQLYEKG